MKEINDKINLEIAEKCLRNSEQFLIDAKSLQEIGSFGHSYALAVLGFEELSKVSVLINMYLGTHQYNKKETKDIFSNHVNKQLLLWNEICGLIVLEWNDIIRKSNFSKDLDKISKDTKKDEKMWDKLFWKLVKKIANDKKEIKASNISLRLLEVENIIQSLNKDNKIMDKRKQNGFYIDIDLEKMEIKNDPFSFTKSNTKLIDTLEGIITFTGGLLRNIQRNVNDPKLAEAIFHIRKFMSYLDKIE